MYLSLSTGVQPRCNVTYCYSCGSYHYDIANDRTHLILEVNQPLSTGGASSATVPEVAVADCEGVAEEAVDAQNLAGLTLDACSSGSAMKIYALVTVTGVVPAFTAQTNRDVAASLDDAFDVVTDVETSLVATFPPPPSPPPTPIGSRGGGGGGGISVGIIAGAAAGSAVALLLVAGVVMHCKTKNSVKVEDASVKEPAA